MVSENATGNGNRLLVARLPTHRLPCVIFLCKNLLNHIEKQTTIFVLMQKKNIYSSIKIF